MTDVDLAPGDSFNKKIRKAQLDQYNYILGRHLLLTLALSSIAYFDYLVMYKALCCCFLLRVGLVYAAYMCQILMVSQNT